MEIFGVKVIGLIEQLKVKEELSEIEKVKLSEYNPEIIKLIEKIKIQNQKIIESKNKNLK